jgi:hypothetical protein
MIVAMASGWRVESLSMTVQFLGQLADAMLWASGVNITLVVMLLRCDVWERVAC